MSSRLLSRLQLLGAATLFSTGGAAIKGAGFTGWEVAAYRSGVAALALFLLLPSSRRRWTWHVPLVGLPYAATLVLFVLANKMTTSANAIFLQSTAPLYLLLLGPWLLGERVRRLDLVFIALLAAGLSLFFLGDQTPLRTAPDPLRGNIIGALSGIAWALTVGGLRWIASSTGASDSAMAVVVAGNAAAFFICLPGARGFAGALTDWLVIAYLGVFQVGLAYVLLTAAVRHIPALEASMLLLAEPALNPVWTALVHGENPGPWAIAGGALILSATAAMVLTGRR